MSDKNRTGRSSTQSQAAELAAKGHHAAADAGERRAAGDGRQAIPEVARELAVGTDRLRVLAEAAAAMVWTADVEGALLNTISSWEHLSDARQVAMRGDGWLEQIHPDDRATVSACWLSAVKTQSAYQCEYRLQDGDLQWRHVLARAAPRVNARGDIEEWVGLCEDVTARKRVEQLQTLEHLVSRSLVDAEVEATTVATIMRAVCHNLAWDCGKYWRLNESAQVIELADCWCLPGQGLEGYLDGCRATPPQPGIGIEGRAWLSGAPILESARDSPAGTPDDAWAQESTLHGACAIPFSRAGMTVGMLSFVSKSPRDFDAPMLETFKLIGDQLSHYLLRTRRADELLRFRTAMDISSDSIWLIDRDTMRFVDVNATACERFGYSRQELLTMGPADLSPDAQQSFEWDYDQLITGDRSSTKSERNLRCKDGTLVRVEARRCVVQSGGRWMIVGISRDLTDRNAAERALRESNEDFRTLAESMPQIVWVCAPDGACTYLNHRWFDDTGEAPDSGHGHNWLTVIHPDDQADCRNAWQHSLASGEPFEAQFRVSRADGSYRWMLSRGLAMSDTKGHILKWFGTWTDIDDHKRDERTILQNAMQQGLIAVFGQKALSNIGLNDLLREAVLAAMAGLDGEFCKLLQVGADGHSFTLNAEAGWKHGATQILLSENDNNRDPRGDYTRALHGAVIIDDFLTQPEYASSPRLRKHAVRSGLEVPIAGKAGAYGVLGIYSREPNHFSTADLNFLYSLTNMLATAIGRKDSEQLLTYQAQFDELTGLPNRRLFLDRLALTLTQAARSEQLVGVIFADLDRFKIINDSLGHAFGDELLVQAAERLAGCTRSGDVVARLGGDEFAVVLSNLAKADDAIDVSQKIVDVLARSFDLGGREVYVSVSLGIAMFPQDGALAETLIKNADTAMYRAKERGRSTFQFYLPEMNERALVRLAMEADLRSAMERDQFLVFYQPKVELVGGKLSGFEALLRWNHPERGLVPALDFITILEDTGLIVPVGEWVVRHVCNQIGTWQELGLHVRPVAINLSARQFQAKNFGVVLTSILRESAVDPRLLEFEMTESMMMSDVDSVIALLNKLKATGVRVSIDDFGTGYSSLAYLRKFPLDALKIDRAFMRDVATDRDDATIAVAIINLAHSLNLRVIAEGVETEVQREFLLANGCDEMQGYYIAPPLAAADCAQMMSVP